MKVNSSICTQQIGKILNIFLPGGYFTRFLSYLLQNCGGGDVIATGEKIKIEDLGKNIEKGVRKTE